MMPEQCAIGAETLVGRVRAIVAREQPRHRERVVERMLQVVVDGVAAEVAGKLAREQPLEIGERLSTGDRVLVPGHVCVNSSSTAWRTDATELTCTVLVTS